jgi:hypothetical protein
LKIQCDDWRHVPIIDEWVWLVEVWCKNKWWTNCTFWWALHALYSAGFGYYMWFTWNSDIDTIISWQFKSDLKLPLAGRRDWMTGILEAQGEYAMYWLSSVYNEWSSGSNFFFDLYGMSIGIYEPRAYGFSVRCFKN